MLSTFNKYYQDNANNMDIVKKEREAIHSGHFMVSHFEAEEQDDEDKEISMPDPDETTTIQDIAPCTALQLHTSHTENNFINPVIDISLTKLFKCMNLAYK